MVGAPAKHTRGVTHTVVHPRRWTTDVGGYHGGNAEDPTYRETIVRWFQYGMTCPLFRQHGARDHTAIWFYGPTDEKILGDIIKLRVSVTPPTPRHSLSSTRPPRKHSIAPVIVVAGEHEVLLLCSDGRVGGLGATFQPASATTQSSAPPPRPTPHHPGRSCGISRTTR